MHDMTPLFLAYIAFVAAMISPGPDFLVVLRNSLSHSARAGVFTALGVAAALSIHMAYCVGGIGLLISQSILLFNILKIVGAAYLVYIGVCALRSRGMAADMELTQRVRKTDRQAFIDGFITNLFNPKATLFFLALFTQMIDPQTSFIAQASFGVSVMITAFIWFSAVSLMMGIAPARRAYARLSKWIDRTMGVFFIALGAKLALAKA